MSEAIAVGLQSLDPILPSDVSLQHEVENIRLRKLWNKKMEYKPRATRYLKTVVLMLSWEETDLKTQPEVSTTSSGRDQGIYLLQVDELQHVFKNSYNFIVEKVRIQQKKPEIEVLMHLSRVIFENNGNSTLFIVYYAGHGWNAGGPEGKFLLGG